MKTPDIRPLTFVPILLATVWAVELPGRQGVLSAEQPPPAGESRGEEQSQLRESMDRRLREVLRTTLPAGSVPRSLASVLGGAAGGGKKAEIVTAYWQTVRAAGEVAAAQEAADRLQSIQVSPADSLIVQGLLAQVAASLQQAKVALKIAQYRLAGTAGLPVDSGLPFPSDIPHTGGYRTYMDRLAPFAAAGWELRMLDRTLPLRRQAMVLHHAAARAAEDAWSAYREAYLGGSPVGPALFRVWKLLWEEEVAFFAAAEDYNLAILGFASRVAPVDLTAAQYVGMLIETAGDASGGENSQRESDGDAAARAAPPGTSPGASAGASAPASSDVLPGASAGSSGGWTAADSGGSGASSSAGPPPSPRGASGTQPSPTPAPPEAGSPGAIPAPGLPPNPDPESTAPPPPQSPGSVELPGIPPAPFAPPPTASLQVPIEGSAATAGTWLPMPAAGSESASASAPGGLPSGDFADFAASAAASPATYLSETEDGDLPPLVPLSPASDGGAVRRVQRYAAPDGETSDAPDAASDPALLVDTLPTLASLPVSEQNRRLAAVLFGRKILPPQAEAANLGDMLRTCPTAERRELLSAYWETAGRKAEYVAWMQQTILLAELFPAALQQWSQPGGALAMLELQAARTAADAGLEDAHCRLIEAAFRLGAVSDRNADMLPIPASSPFAGPYAARAEALPASLRARSDIQTYLVRLEGDFEAMSHRLRAAAAWDQARRAAESRFIQGTGPLGEVLELADAELRELLRYAAAAEAYNQGIAEYVVTAYPDLTPDVLLGALGVTGT